MSGMETADGASQASVLITASDTLAQHTSVGYP